MRKRQLFRLLCLLAGVVALTAASTSQPARAGRYMLTADPQLLQTLTGSAPGYLDQPSFAPQDAQYFDLVDRTFGLNGAELELLEQNGFAVSERIAFGDFTTAYGYIYWKDLPVLVTTDSIMQAVHQSYDDLLKQMEAYLLTPQMTAFLTAAREQVRADAAANTDPELAPLYADVETFLTVPLALLSAGSFDTPGAVEYVGLAQGANTVTDVTLFGSTRAVDFTQFTPRGHYAESELLTRYFRAMQWLAQIDFRILAADLMGTLTLNHGDLVAALILRDTIDRAGQREQWEVVDSLFTAFVGRSDNMTLADFDRFLTDANIATPADAQAATLDSVLAIVNTGEYGQQRITGQILQRDPALDTPLQRPLSLMLLGQRYAIDSYVMSELVYDRLQVDGRFVERPLPSPLDVMVALGSDRAAAHLGGELERYGYAQPLADLRAKVDALDPAFWGSSIYNRWLGMLRALNTETTSANYPQAMRTAAWADKMLQTQLASWTQLRHDNILYIKPSYTMTALCEYPAGYVEPYPDFYAAVGDYAGFGRHVFEDLDPALLTDGTARTIREQAIAYFTTLGDVSERLRVMAEKELRLEAFTADEEQFLKSIVIREKMLQGCVEVDGWDGWYTDLLPWQGDHQDDNPALIADIHTNPNNDPSSPLYPPTTLHVGTGRVAAALFIGDTDEGATIYVGPALTYYEIVEEGFPPVRLTDADWNGRLDWLMRPTPPEWTASFRIGSMFPPALLDVPREE